MRIRRPSRPEAPFKRKRGPPPQATKLLRYSLAAGIVFIVLLAIVFVPRMLIPQEPVATPVQMTFITSTQLQVTSVGAVVSLSKLQATLLRDNATVATLGPPLGGGNATFSFTDANGDNLLGPGDYFSVSVGPTGCHRVDIVQTESGSSFIVGREIWGGCPST